MIFLRDALLLTTRRLLAEYSVPARNNLEEASPPMLRRMHNIIAQSRSDTMRDEILH